MTLYRDLLNQGAGSQQRRVTVKRLGARATATLDEPARLSVLSAPLVLQTKQALTELAAPFWAAVRARLEVSSS